MLNEIKIFLKDNYLLVLVLIIILSMPFILYFANFWSDGVSDSQEIWGQFGDFIGGIINPIFSFITVLFVIYTIHLQLKNNKESEFLNKLKIIENKINNIYESLYPSRVYFGKSENADSQNITFKKILNNLFNDNLFKSPDSKTDKLDYNEDVFQNELTNIMKLFNLLENELIQYNNIYNNIDLLNFYKDLYSGEIHIINTVIESFNKKVGKCQLSGILWFDDIKTFRSIYPGML